MQSSPTINKIAPALLKAQTEMGNAKKEATNPFFKKAYADLNSVREAVLPVLNKNGISVIQPTCVVDGKNYVETIMLHESGEYISSFTEIITDKVNDAQRHGSGLSYARRYALASIANIGAEDDDANNATGKAEPAVKKKPAPFTLSHEAAKELESLINNSTLNANDRAIATNSITNATSQVEIDKIKARLLQLQTV